MIELMGLAVAANDVEVVEIYAGKNLLQEEIFANRTVKSLPPSAYSSPNTNIADYLERFPGLNKAGQGGLFQSYSVRGLSAWRIRTTVDGIPIITDRRAGNSASFLPPSLVALIEVNRSSGSLLHGSGALGGVLNLSTRKPEELTFSITQQAPTNATSMTIGHGSMSNSFAASFRQSDNAKTASGLPLNSEYKQFAASLYHQGNLFDHYDYNISWLPSLGSDIGKSSLQYPETQLAIYPEDNHSLMQATLYSDSWLIKAFHHYQNWDSLVKRIGKRENLTAYQSHTYGMNLYSSTHASSSSWRFGVDWISRGGIKIADSETSLEHIKTDQVLIDGNTHNFAPYASAAIKLADLKINLGARYDYFKAQNAGLSRTDNHLSYQGAIERQAKNHTFKASYSTAFRFPSITELYFNGVTPRGNTFGNESLEPETSKTLEFNYLYSHSVISGRLNVYKSELRNFIERTKLSNGDRTYNNLDNVSLSGFEVAVDFTPMPEHAFTWSLAKQSGQQSNGEFIQGITPLKTNLSHRTYWREIELSSELSHRFKKHRVSPAEQEISSSTTLNAYAKWKINKHWAGTFKITNLLDSEFKTTADEDAPFVEERQIAIQLDWQN
ncbi:hypothetical protein N474_10105 [Pseudoalteromonas luteoviolacea CPMOR-2]|uniref:TonB-dependent receptor n=1 Tax=Pseudoalteromonas luteoviolacea TaxID=43657 RepID=UPI0007B04C96|nr:TonB-dependent receptor [Pseudoalteromonas luteoviolacea]KZN56965.1 hypothetical protein N474_10105 [Pseudoalteromonas luteoviolacea CPMOR-2]